LACYDFYLGKLVIAIVVDLARVKKQFRDYDIVAEFKADEQRPLKLSKQGLETPISIGSHLFNRVFVEFLSLRWLIDELANRFHSADSILAEFLADNPK
jgi:hypothetical protein